MPPPQARHDEPAERLVLDGREAPVLGQCCTSYACPALGLSASGRPEEERPGGQQGRGHHAGGERSGGRRRRVGRSSGHQKTIALPKKAACWRSCARRSASSHIVSDGRVPEPAGAAHVDEPRHGRTRSGRRPRRGEAPAGPAGAARPTRARERVWQHPHEGLEEDRPATAQARPRRRSGAEVLRHVTVEEISRPRRRAATRVPEARHVAPARGRQPCAQTSSTAPRRPSAHVPAT